MKKGPSVPEKKPQGKRALQEGKDATSQPYAALDPIQTISWKYFKGWLGRKVTVDISLEESLEMAHMRIRANEFTAYVLFSTLVLALPLGIGLGVGIAVMGLLMKAGPAIFVVATLPPVILPLVTWVMLKSLPASKAKARGRDIDRKLFSAMTFISAMASADVNIDMIFKELAGENIYGEVAEEAAWITRDTELLGMDIYTAIRRTAARTPSKRMQDFLQGVVTTATTGGQLKPYFLIKAEQYERENQLDNIKRTETMGLMAETFVTAVVAFPLFLIIMIAIFVVVGSSGYVMSDILWVIVLVMIPSLQGVFIWLMALMAKEGQA